MINLNALGYPQTLSIIEKSYRSCYMLISLPKFRTNVSLFVSVIRLAPAELWDFLETRMLYD